MSKREVVSTTGKLLIWPRVSTSEGLFQTRSTKYIKGIVFSSVKFLTEMSVLQFDKIHVPVTNIEENVKTCPVVS